MTLAQADDSFDPLEPDEALSAREYLRVLWHDKWRIVGLALLLAIVFGAVGVVAVQPRYRADATVTMDPVALEQLLDTTGEPRDLQADLADELNVAADPQVEAAVLEQLGFAFDGAVRLTEGSSSSLDFSASADDAAQAQQALDALVAAFLARRIELGVALVDEEIRPCLLYTSRCV